MRCVDCDVDMMLYNIKGIQLDVCPQCRGLWFDTGEIESCLKLSAHDIKESFGDVVVIPKCEGLQGPPRNCPRCHTPLDKERFHGGVWIDKCPNRCGIWLDDSELALVRAELEASKGRADSKKSAMHGTDSFLLSLVKFLVPGMK